MKGQSAFPNAVIRARAGTGKTYQLAVRFIGLLAAGARPDEILATTFTRKAAGEILDRICSGWRSRGRRRRTREAGDGDGPKTAQPSQVPGAAHGDRPPAAHAAVWHARQLLLQVATSFGHELGLPPGWTTREELDDGTAPRRSDRADAHPRAAGRPADAGPFADEG